MQDHAADFYSPFGRTSRTTYLVRTVVLGGLAAAAVMLRGDGGNLLSGVLLVLAVVLWFFTAVTRGNDAGWPWWMTLIGTLLFSIIAAVVLAIVPTRDGFGPSRLSEFKPSRLP